MFDRILIALVVINNYVINNYVTCYTPVGKYILKVGTKKVSQTYGLMFSVVNRVSRCLFIKEFKIIKESLCKANLIW